MLNLEPRKIVSINEKRLKNFMNCIVSFEFGRLKELAKNESHKVGTKSVTLSYFKRNKKKSDR